MRRCRSKGYFSPYSYRFLVIKLSFGQIGRLDTRIGRHSLLQCGLALGFSPTDFESYSER